MVIVAGASYYDPGQGTRGGSIILPSRFLSILIYFSIIFCGRTHAFKNGTPIVYEPENIEFINSLQVIWAERFVYAKERAHLERNMSMKMRHLS